MVEPKINSEDTSIDVIDSDDGDRTGLRNDGCEPWLDLSRDPTF